MRKSLGRIGFALLLLVLVAFIALATWEPFWAKRGDVALPRLVGIGDRQLEMRNGGGGLAARQRGVARHGAEPRAIGRIVVAHLAARDRENVAPSIARIAATVAIRLVPRVLAPRSTLSARRRASRARSRVPARARGVSRARGAFCGAARVAANG